MQNKSDWRKASRNVCSTEFKMRMVELVLLPGASIAAIARENGFNDNLPATLEYRRPTDTQRTACPGSHAGSSAC